MRVLVSGVTSDLGRAFARAALGAGHDLVGVGHAEHRDLAPEVAFTPGDAATAESLVAGSDVVVHLSPVEREVPGSGGIPALRRLATAAARHGLRFVTPITHGPDAADADRVVRDSGSRHVVVRTAPVGGRHLDWQACRTVATLVGAPKDTQWRLLHGDDLVRFLVFALTTDRTGVVALAAPDVILAGEARAALRGVGVRGIPRWPVMSTSERKATARDWGFECGWTSADVVADLARGARGRRLTRDGAVEVVTGLPIPTEPLPRRRQPADGTPLVSVALPSMAVELDDRIDTRFPVFSAQRTAELFSGPLTPLSADVHTSGLRAAGRTLATVAGLTGPVADEWESRGHVVFGHHLYAAVSAAAAAPPPGWTEHAVVEAHLGPRADPDLFPLGRPDVPSGLRGLATRLGAWTRFAKLARRYRATVRDFAEAAGREGLAGEVVTRTDAELAVRARLLHDRLAEGWTLTQLGTLVAHAAGAPLRRRAKGDVTLLGRGADAAHEPAYPAVTRLAGLLRGDDELRALAEWGDLDAVRQKFPEFATAFDEVLASIGHRGPNEVELSGRPFAERPELLFSAALATARRPTPSAAPVTGTTENGPPDTTEADTRTIPPLPAERTDTLFARAERPGDLFTPAEPGGTREGAGGVPAADSDQTAERPGGSGGRGGSGPEQTGGRFSPVEPGAGRADGYFSPARAGDDPFASAEPGQPADSAGAGRAPGDPRTATTAVTAAPEAVPAPVPEATPATPARPKRTLAEKVAVAGQRQRELAIDATIRYTGELRGLVREWGRRQVRAGRLVDVDDAFFLTLDELLALPPDLLTRIERRRADRDRLSGVRMPAVVSGSWRPEVVDYPTPEGKQLHGLGVSAGVVEGPVRVLTDGAGEVEPGDVLVLRAADVGHAALLGAAAAIVTDLGGPLSRAAVVARELGVPCVTGTRDASARLASGTVVRVDGTTGDVTVLMPASASAP